MKNFPVWNPRTFPAVGLALTSLFAGCSDSTGVSGAQNVTVGFRTVDHPAMASWTGSTGALAQHDGISRSLIILGTNGTLVIDRVLMIVSAIELEHEDGCDDNTGATGLRFDECEDFEADPQLIDLPLGGAPIAVTSALVAPGIYDELKIEIEELDLDDLGDDEDGRVVRRALRAEVRWLVPDWPEKASVLVTGTFQAPGEGPVAFRTFIEADVEIELDLIPNLIIGHDGSANRTIFVDLRPALWFLDNQGAVRDLTRWDYDLTGRLLELELEIENGSWSVEVDD